MSFFQRLAQRITPYDESSLPREVARNLRIIILAVLIGTVCFSVTGGSAFTGYIKALSASDFMLGLLMAMPFCVRIFQLIASYILERTKKRKFLMISMGMISRLLWLPISLVPFFIPMEQPLLRIWSVLVLYSLSAVTGTFLDSCFFSLAADAVPMNIRGRFFSVRSKLTMVVGVLSGLVISYLLDNISGNDGLLGYIICFIIAAVFGTGDIVCYFFMHFPPMEGERSTGKKAKPIQSAIAEHPMAIDPAPIQEEPQDSFFSMIAQVFRNKPFIRLVIYWTLWAFGVNIMAPYFSVYMLSSLQMTFTEIVLITTIPANLLSFLLVQRWGRVMDQYGYKALLYVCSAIAGIIPFLWLFCGPRYFGILLFSHMLSGSVWPAIDLSSQNTIMNAAPARNRSMYTAVYMVITQLCGVALSFVVGGFLLDHVFTPLTQSLIASGHTFFGLPITQYHFLLALTGILRLSIPFLFLPMTKLDQGVSAISTIKEIARSSRMTFQRNLSMAKAQIQRKIFRRREQKEIDHQDKK